MAETLEVCQIVLSLQMIMRFLPETNEFQMYR